VKNIIRSLSEHFRLFTTNHFYSFPLFVPAKSGAKAALERQPTIGLFTWAPLCCRPIDGSRRSWTTHAPIL